MGLVDRVRAGRGETRNSIDQWVNDYLIPAYTFNGVTYPITGVPQTMIGGQVRDVATTLPAYLNALKTCPPAFAAQLVRSLTLSGARFVFRNRATRHVYGANESDGRRNTELRILERPWANGNTADLINRVEWHAGLAGNAFVYRDGSQARVLRPDWVAPIWGSNLSPDEAPWATDSELVGYVYQPGGFYSNNDPIPLLPESVAHFAPIPDPAGGQLGISWITPALRDIQGDRAATDHKLQFFTNAATPNMVIRGLPSASREMFDEAVAMLESQHAGIANAYRTLYLTLGADATVVGSSLKEMDFKLTQGAGETRISVLSRVPAVLLGISEGLAGSSLNEGNFGMARRSFADTWVFPTLGNLANSLEQIIRVPDGSELWFDTADMPILREDEKDAANIANIDGQTIAQYVREGFTAESAVAAVNARDVTLLEHTGLVSVQMQLPGTWHGVADPAPGGETPAEADATDTTPKPVAAAPATAPPKQLGRSEQPLVVQVVRDLPPEVHNHITNAPHEPARTVTRTVERDDNGDIVRIIETTEED